MNWWRDYRLDIARNHPESRWQAVKLVLTEPGLWALLEYRVSRAAWVSGFYGIPFIKRLVRILLILWHRIVETLTGISLPCTARIGPGLFLPHCGFRVIHHDAVIGAECTITQGVTIGISGRGNRRGVPTIGDRVYIGPNATVVGKINVGSGVLVAANSLVNRDTSDRTTVIGVPASEIHKGGSDDYLRLDKK